MNMAGIKVESTDSSENFISYIKVEDIPTNDSFFVLKSEAEEESFTIGTMKEEVNLQETIIKDEFYTERAAFCERIMPGDETSDHNSDTWETIVARSERIDEIVPGVDALMTNIQDKTLTRKSQRKLKTTEKPVLMKNTTLGKSARCFKSFPDSCTNRYLPWKCHFCDKSYEFKNLLEEHSRIHSIGKAFMCKICSKIFQKKIELELHLTLHTDENPMKCKVCGKILSSAVNLKIHMRVHTRKSPFICSTCGKYLSSAISLKNHLLIHSGEKPHRCEICSKSFRYKVSYRIHKRIHTGENPLECKICNKRFGYHSKLKFHMLTHSRSNTISGSVHVGSSKSNSSVNELMCSVSIEKLLKCDMCCKMFARLDSLRRHIRTQSCVKSYKCGLCERRFVDNGSRIEHVRLHRQGHLFKCLVCAELFPCHKTFEYHMQIHKGENLLQCDESGKK